MSFSSPPSLSLSDARKILTEYSCTQTKTVETEAEKQRLRQALLTVTHLSDWENIGVCADNATQGMTALISYLTALGYSVKIEPTANVSEHESVYLKYNTQRMSYLIDTYTGDYRGVLVACQSEDDAIAGTYGHFPLDLFF